MTSDLSEQNIKKLLAVVMAYDNRKPGAMSVLAWGEAARRGRWTFDAALEAVHQHYATSTEFLMPAHLTTLIRARMRAPQPVSEAVAYLEAASPASEETRRRAMEEIRRCADRFKLPGDVA